MVPSSVAAVLCFMLLVAPGLLFDMLAARRRAGTPESAFHEASRVVLASLAYDAGIINQSFYATLILLVVVTSLAAGSWLERVVRRGRPLL